MGRHLHGHTRRPATATDGRPRASGDGGAPAQYAAAAERRTRGADAAAAVHAPRLRARRHRAQFYGKYILIRFAQYRPKLYVSNMVDFGKADLQIIITCAVFVLFNISWPIMRITIAKSLDQISAQSYL